MRNFGNKGSIENPNTFFNFFSEYRAVYGIMWKNIVQPDKSDDNIKRQREGVRIQNIGRQTQTHTHTHTNVIFNIYCFSQKLLLHERASMLLDTYIACIAELTLF
jgi:hypothetical protein